MFSSHTLNSAVMQITAATAQSVALDAEPRGRNHEEAIDRIGNCIAEVALRSSRMYKARSW